MDPKKNPHYLDDDHAYMKCLTDHRLAVHAIDRSAPAGPTTTASRRS
jgi:hypothetical protein